MDKEAYFSSIWIKHKHKCKLMRKYLLDCNIYDEIVSDRIAMDKIRILAEKGYVKLYANWIVKAELERISSNEKKKRIESILSSLNVSKIPVAGILLDHSKLNDTMLIPWNETALLSEAISTSQNNDNDMAIAITAKIHGAKLVTNDKKLLSKAHRIFGAEVLDWDEFIFEISILQH